MSITSMCQVNLSNEQEYESHLDLLDEVQLHYYNYAFSHFKKEYLNYHDEYFSNARFIIHAEPAFVKKYCFCGLKNGANPSGICACRQYCPKCAWLTYRKVWRPFEHSFHKGTFHFLTLSYNGFINFDINPYDINMYWDAAKYALTKAEKSKYIRGAVIAFEIHVEQYLPTLVNPHAHAIVEADLIGDGILEQLSTWMSEYLVKEMVKEGMDDDLPAQPLDEDQIARLRTPNLQVSSITDEELLAAKFQYSLKRIVLASAYRSAWVDKVVAQPELAVTLNSQIKDFIIGLAHLSMNKKKYIKMGTMHGRNKHYIGSKVPDNREDDNESEEQIAA